jgi:hypothetical protein
MATSIEMKMVRDRALWPESWNMPYPEEPDLHRVYEWVPFRQEIFCEPLPGSFFFSAIEKIPYSLSFNVGPMYVQFHNCNWYTRLDKAQAAFLLLVDKLKSKDKTVFFNNYKRNLTQAYEKVDNIVERIERERSRFTKMDPEELLDLFKRWWRIHDDLFSLTFWLQIMSNGIIWPEIRRILTKQHIEEPQVNQYLSLLTLPTTKVASIKFRDECIELFSESSEDVKEIVYSKVDPHVTLEKIGELEGGEEWLRKFENFVDRWRWIRDILFVSEPLNTKEKMIDYVKKHLTRDDKTSKPEENLKDFNGCVEKLRRLLPEVKLDDFFFFLDAGRFMQIERDNHHMKFLKHTDGVRELLLELGRRLKKEELLYHERDVFFLFIHELFQIFIQEVSKTEKEKKVSKIPDRMTALTYVSKLKLHDRPGYDPEKIPERDGEYY